MSKISPAAQPGDYILGKAETFRVFSLLCLLMVFDFADRLIVAALLPAIRLEWHINDAQAGLLSSVLTLGMVVFALPVSIAVDRWSRIKTASLMGVGWSLASFSGAFVGSFSQLALTRGLIGAGEAAYAPASYAWIAAAFPHRRLQLALGLFSAAQPVGMAFGVALGGWIAAHYGWRHALGVVAIPGLLVALWLYRGRDYKNPTALERNPADKQSVSSWAQIRKTPSLLLAYLASGMGTLQWVPVFYFLPTYLNRLHGIPLQQASLMASGIMLLGIVGVPLGGWLMDHWSVREPRAKLFFSITTLTIATFFYAAAFGWASRIEFQYGLIVAASFVAATGGTGALSMTQELVHPAARALSGTCSIMTIHLLGSVPGPFLVGWLSDRYGLTQALFGVVAVSGLLSGAALAFAARYYLRDLARVGQFRLEAA